MSRTDKAYFSRQSSTPPFAVLRIPARTPSLPPQTYHEKPHKRRKAAKCPESLPLCLCVTLFPIETPAFPANFRVLDRFCHSGYNQPLRHP